MNVGILIFAAGAAALLYGRAAQASTDSVEVDMNSPGAQKFGDAWFKYDMYFKKAAADYDVPFNWLKGIAIIESSLATDPLTSAGAVSSDGKSWGIMQVTLTTAQDLDGDASVDKLNNPAYSIDLAGKYLSQLSDMFNGDERKVIMSYNQGPGNTQKGKTFAAGYYTKFLGAVTLLNGG